MAGRFYYIKWKPYLHRNHGESKNKTCHHKFAQATQCYPFQIAASRSFSSYPMRDRSADVVALYAGDRLVRYGIKADLSIGMWDLRKKNDSQTAYVTADLLSPVRRSRMIMEAEFSLPSLRDWITTTTTRTIEIIQLHQQQSESPPALHDKKSRIFAVIDSRSLWRWLLLRTTWTTTLFSTLWWQAPHLAFLGKLVA